jgi:hypothetical protein
MHRLLKNGKKHNYYPMVSENNAKAGYVLSPFAYHWEGLRLHDQSL